MIGDDIEIDVQGAQRMGMQGWLVKTGRFRTRGSGPRHLAGSGLD